MSAQTTAGPGQVRAIHAWGPRVGEYVPAAATDIRCAFERERQRLAGERVHGKSGQCGAADWLAPRHEPACARAGEPFAVHEVCGCMFNSSGAVFG